jgi:tRNA-dihydrouridine synthase
MLNQTGCDGVMIGRGSIGNPWIFNNKKPTIKLRKKTIIQHLKLLRKTDGEKKAVMLIKPHIKQYLHDIKNRKEFTQKIMFCKEYKEVIKIIKSII